MYYDTRTQTSGLPHNPYTACVVPRPIGWISTVSKVGVHNIAPFAQFQNLTHEPPTVMFSVCGLPEKDTLVNVRDNGEFVWSVATFEQREKVVGSAATFGPDVDEFEALGIEWQESEQVKPRRVAASPIHFECKLLQFVDIPSESQEGKATVVLGRVVGIHIRDDVITKDGRVDYLRYRPLARLGYLDYTAVSEVFEINVPPPEGYQPVEGLRANSSGLFHMSEAPKGSGATIKD